MLKTLCIENIAVIERADIEFSSGLNVLTGETGAGKSIVVDSINAILGERTSKELIRNGALDANVTALFEDIGAETMAKLEEFGIECEDDTLLLSRKISSQGKSVCRVNGVVTTVSMLKEIGQTIVNIHGQHDSQALLNPDMHYRFIDAYGNLSDDIEKYVVAFKELLSLRRKLKALTTDADERDKQLELLDFQIKEIENADIKVGEWNELKKRKNVILNSQAIAQALDTVLSSLNGGDDFSGIITFLQSDAKEVLPISEVDDDLKKISTSIDEAAEKIESLKDIVLSKLDSVDFDEKELDLIEERLSLLYSFSKKYGETEEDMLKYLEQIKVQRQMLDNSEEELERLNEMYSSKLDEVVDLADELTARRKESAKRLSNEICSQLEFLDMPKIKFSADFSQGNLSITGRDKVELLISTNVGEPPKPLSKIASGGELSRIMLAIKSVLAKNDGIKTLIFDEIDTGVSGKASRKIGLKLKDVSRSSQVICVTHSAQIASTADNHYLISKKYENDRTYTSVTLLDFEARKRELARIMGGLEITDALLLSAEELLNDNEIVFI